MKIPVTVRCFAAGGAAWLLLAGCVDRPFPQETSAPEDVQKQYDEGKINAYEYDTMMKSINPQWKGQPPGNSTTGNTTENTTGNTTGNTTDQPPVYQPYQYSYPSNTM